MSPHERLQAKIDDLRAELATSEPGHFFHSTGSGPLDDTEEHVEEIRRDIAEYERLMNAEKAKQAGPA